MRRIAAILHNPVSADARPDDRDLLHEIAAVSQSLQELGFSVTAVPFGLNLAACKRALHDLSPHFVFNLVETFDDSGALQSHAPAMLKHWGYRFTGGTAEALLITTDKILCKEFMQALHIPTPGWYVPGGSGTFEPGKRYIVKAIAEDASLGIEPSSVAVFHREEELIAFITEREARFGCPFFAERFIDGREFNISVVGNNGRAQVLPAAEIRFIGFGADRPKIVDYRAKWDEDTFEFKNTVRSFDYPSEDAALLQLLQEETVRCWEAFKLTGYGRVDYRVDEEGKPWVLELNVNPCISPDGGLAAAATHNGWSYRGLIERIVGEALK